MVSETTLSGKEVVSENEPEIVSMVPEPKRKPGRPKGALNKATLAKQTSEPPPPPVSYKGGYEEEVAPPVVKAKRVRSTKKPPPPSSGIDNSSSSEDSAAPEPTIIVKQKKKAKPKRKHRQRVVVVSGSSSESSEEIIVQRKKRKPVIQYDKENVPASSTRDTSSTANQGSTIGDHYPGKWHADRLDAQRAVYDGYFARLR